MAEELWVMGAGETSARSGWASAGLQPGSVVGGYRVESPIGAGGMAMVFRATDEVLGRLVALKVLASAMAGDPEFRERFVRESRAVAAIDHSHIVPVYAAGEDGGVLYIAMRFISGGDLRGVMRREGPQRGDRAVSLLAPIAAALDAAHAADLVHRDVKPANILVECVDNRPDRLYLADFGIAKGTASSRDLTGAGQFLGTLDYCAPEQIDGKRPVPQTDQYALAGVTYTMLTGAVPFPREETTALLWAHLSEPPPAPTLLRPDLPQAVDEVIARAMAKSPDERYPTCREFIGDLRAALDDTNSRNAGRSPAVDTVPPEPAATSATSATGAPHLLPTEVTQSIAPAPRGHSAALRSRPVRYRRPAVMATTAVVLAVAATATALALKHPGPGTGRLAAASTPSPPPSPRLLTQLQGLKPGGPDSFTVAFQSNGRALLETMSASGTAQLWNLDSYYTNSVSAFDLFASPEGEISIEADPNQQSEKAILWDLRSYDGINPGTVDGKFSMPYENAPNEVIVALSLSDTGTVAVTSGITNAAHVLTGGDADVGVTDVWNAKNGTRVATLTDPDRAPLADVEISPDGQTLAAIDAKGTLYIWNVPTKSVVATLADPAGASQSHHGNQYATFSADGKALAVQTSTDSVYVWDLAHRTQSATLRLSFLAVSAGGELIASAVGTGKIDVVSVATKKIVYQIEDKDGQAAVAGAFSPNGRDLATVSAKNKIYVWQLPAV